MALTEGRHAAEFVMSEAEGHRSRDNGILKSGEDLAAGTVVMWENGNPGDKLIEYVVSTGAAVAGVLLYKTDATADTYVSYMARDCEVNLKLLTYPDTDPTAGTDKAATIAGLKELGIIVRDEE